MNTMVKTATLEVASPEKRKVSIDWRLYRSVIALAVIGIVLAFLTEGTFLSPRNLTNLTRQVAINGILAVGMTYVILIGGIDLSALVALVLLQIALMVLGYIQGSGLMLLA